MRKIGSKIRTLRLSHQLTQRQLGLAIGISCQQIQKYEAGVSDLSITRLIQICIVLNSEIEEVLGSLRSQKIDPIEVKNHSISFNISKLFRSNIDNP